MKWSLLAADAATDLIEVEHAGLTVVLRPSTHSSKREARALAGALPVYGVRCLEAAREAAELAGIDFEAQLGQIAAADPDAHNAIGRAIDWNESYSAARVAVALVELRLDGDVVKAPKSARDRLALLDRLKPIAESGDKAEQKAAAQAFSTLIEQALAAIDASGLDEEGKEPSGG